MHTHAAVRCTAMLQYYFQHYTGPFECRRFLTPLLGRPVVSQGPSQGWAQGGKGPKTDDFVRSHFGSRTRNPVARALSTVCKGGGTHQTHDHVSPGPCFMFMISRGDSGVQVDASQKLTRTSTLRLNPAQPASWARLPWPQTVRPQVSECSRHGRVVDQTS